MNMAWNKIGTIVIAVVVLLILWAIYFPSGGLFDNVKDIVEDLKENAIDISVGMEELTPSNTSLPPSAQKEASSIEQVLNDMADSSKSNCFQKVPGGFNNDFGTEKGSVSFTFRRNDAEDSTTVSIKSDKNFVYAQFSVPKMKLCVVAGNKLVTENFFNKFILKAENDGPYLTKVNGLEIFYSEIKSNGNVIKVFDPPWTDAVNDESQNFESNGILFKGDNNFICFIPTNWAVNYDEDGIDNDYISDDSNEQSLAYKLNHNQLNLCKG